MYNKLDGLFLCPRDSETPNANLGEKSHTPLNNLELRNATNNSVALGPFFKSGPPQQGFCTFLAQTACCQHAARYG